MDLRKLPKQVGAVVQATRYPATIGKAAHRFLKAVDAQLGESPTVEQYQAAVETALQDKKLRGLESGLRVLADSAWLDKGPTEIKRYLKVESEIAHDADARDGWNRDVRKTLGPMLKTVVRKGRKELTTADTVQAFALEHGIPMLATTIRERYQPPKVDEANKQSWAAELTAALKDDLGNWPKWEAPIDLNKAEQLSSELSNTLEVWANLTPPEQMKVFDQIKEKAEEYRDQPLHVLFDLLKGFATALNRVPSEVHLIASASLSVAIAVKIGIDVATLPAALMTTAAILGGWFVADILGALFHHRADNYPFGRLGREFIAHHYDTKAVSKWPLRRNAGGLVKPTLPAMALAAYFLPGGALAGFLLTLFNGLIFTQHVHGYSHADAKDLPAWVRALQKAKIFLPPEMHKIHHGKPIGKECYGVLNGWSNWISDKTELWRQVEKVYKHYTGMDPTWIAEKEKEVRQLAMVFKREGLRAGLHAEAE